MTTTYIDPQNIFASDAPTQDKPPAFNNYIKGMDETRSNDGRPTIKQFNFIQQQNDFKFLYIHERGACLPFVEGFPYENNAIVFKDGFIQQKNGSSWVIPFMRGSQNLAELTDVAQARTKLDVYSKAETDAIAGTPDATETVAGKAKIATTAIAQAGMNDTDIITPLKLKNTVLGVGQTWQNMTSQRLRETTYTNTTGKLIAVAVTTNSDTLGKTADIIVDGVSLIGTTIGGAVTKQVSSWSLIPAEATYSISITSNTYTWWELR